MELICIYGATGIGKRTTGEALAKLTGFTLFHNHLTIDPALVLLPLRGEETFPIINRFRFALLRAAAKRGEHKGVIVTAGTYAGQKNKWMDGLARLGREDNINLQLVHIHADRDVHLKERVRGETRKNFTKTRDTKEVGAQLDENDYRIPRSKKHLSIDTTKLSAKQTAKIIYNELF